MEDERARSCSFGAYCVEERRLPDARLTDQDEGAPIRCAREHIEEDAQLNTSAFEPGSVRKYFAATAHDHPPAERQKRGATPMILRVARGEVNGPEHHGPIRTSRPRRIECDSRSTSTTTSRSSSSRVAYGATRWSDA